MRCQSSPRIYGYLIDHIERDPNDPNQGVIRNFAKHEDIGRLIGADRYAVAHLIGNLQKMGLVRREKRTYYFLDIDALEYLRGHD